jgi:hypothetical protein
MRRRTFGLLLLLALATLASETRGGPDEAKTFKGQLVKGGSQSFALPAQSKGFWRVVLEGDTAEVDLDLRLEAEGKKLGSSRGEEASEELLVPARKGLTAVVDHYDGRPSGFTLRCEPISAARRLAPGKSAAGQANADGAPYAVHELPAMASKFCAVALEAPGAGEDVDLDLHVYDADWKELAKSTGDAAAERVVLSPSRAARWVVVRAWKGGTDYALAVEPLGEAGARLGIDEVSKGALEVDGERYFRLRTTAAGIVTLRLEGPKDVDFDLQVYGPDGYYRESVAADALEEIAINGAKRGDYLVRVYAGTEGAGGDFTLGTERLDVSKLATNGRGGSKMWGLFVGIANYEEVGNLTYTCGDALSIYQAFCGQGEADRRRSIVLLDELARRQDVVSGLEAIAARADEDDVFVFFYSGHGGNDAGDGQRGDAKDERDGGDEYIVCQDSTSGSTAGDLVDDDLKALLDKIKCKQQLLFFDACHAGGFAEVIDRDGRYGCFSSLETQTSTEAISLKNGLLTAILIKALAGDADADTDGKVTLAEVSAYVERVQPNMCPSCQGALTPQDTRCRECGEDLSGPEARQIPVIVNRADDSFVLTKPDERARGRARSGR